MLTKDEARRIAANFAKLPELLRKPGGGCSGDQRKITDQAVVAGVVVAAVAASVS